MVDRFARLLGANWTVKRAGGLTGAAYIAQNGKEQLFLKRNSSPFLAVLSAEGLVPKLIWTKRLENGDVITAQRWIEGRPLEREEMKHEQIIHLLKKIHESNELLNMLKRLGKQIMMPEDLLGDLLEDGVMKELVDEYQLIQSVIELLKHRIHIIEPKNFTVCHGDLHHTNLIKTKEDKYLLVDWDNTLITDPLFDIALILESYIEPDDWQDWLQAYGYEDQENLDERIGYYVLLHNLSSLIWYTREGIEDQKEKRLQAIKNIYSRYIKE